QHDTATVAAYGAACVEAIAGSGPAAAGGGTGAGPAPAHGGTGAATCAGSWRRPRTLPLTAMASTDVAATAAADGRAGRGPTGAARGPARPWPPGIAISEPSAS